jgi:Pvc16 N-terminal domain
MSNSLAIAAVTATLVNMLDSTVGGVLATLPLNFPTTLGLTSVSVTAKPLDKARGPTDTGNQINIYLYQVLPNAAMRNNDMPLQVRPGETAQPPVALTLHYLVSAYGQADDDTAAHVLLGQTMRIFNDNAVLDRQTIADALSGNDLFEQVERVRLTLYPLSSDEIAKLWTAFSTQYRISAAYLADVVLIESAQASRTPLPVLTRGSNDSGIIAQASLLPPFPTILSVQLPKKQCSALPGDLLTINGHNLNGDSVTVRFSAAVLATPRIAPATGTAQQVTATVPVDPANFPAGSYTVAVIVSAAGQPDRFTNEYPLQVAPVLSNILPASAPAGSVTFTVDCAPDAQATQRVSLLFGDAEVLAQPFTAPASNLTFVVAAAAAGGYYLRLRVDGVDSLLVDRSVRPPVFDPTQKVTIT